MKEKLALNNLNPVCGRIEALELGQFDIAVSRAVADLAKISEYALPKLKKGGYFIAYKSKKADEEIKNSKNVLKKYKSEIVDTIDYTLPLEDIYERKLICIKKEDISAFYPDPSSYRKKEVPTIITTGTNTYTVNESYEVVKKKILGLE